MIRQEYNAIEALRRAARCSPSCAITYAFYDGATISFDRGEAHYPGLLMLVEHNGQSTPLYVGEVANPNADIWSWLLQKWALLAHDLHREEAMQSDWPVF